MAQEYSENKEIERSNVPPAPSSALAKSWMKNIIGDLSIKELTLFGTHSSCDPKIQNSSSDSPLMDQFNNGVRFIDLHLVMHDNKVWVYHDIPRIKLECALDAVESFISANNSEFIFLYLQSSKPPAVQVDWSEAKKVLMEYKEKLVPKGELNLKLNTVRGKIILIAPNDLKIDTNWGKDSIIPYFAPEDTDTLVGLHAFLFELAVDELDEDKGKLVWVEARSRREEDEKKKEDEVEEVNKTFLQDIPSPHYNIVTLSLVDETYFEKLKGYVLPKLD